MKSINLIPPKTRDQKRKALTYGIVLGIAGLLLVGQGLFGGILQIRANDLEPQIQADRLESDALMQSGYSSKQLQQYKELGAFIEGVRSNRTNWTPYIMPLIGYLPAGASIDSVQATAAGQLHVEVLFQQYPALIQYMNAMERMAEFQVTQVNMMQANTNANPAVKTHRLVLNIKMLQTKEGTP